MRLIQEYPEFTLYELSPQIYYIEVDNLVKLGMHMLRLSETQDHPKYRGQYIELIEYIYEYQLEFGKGIFDYCKQFCGFNVGKDVFQLVYN